MDRRQIKSTLRTTDANQTKENRTEKFHTEIGGMVEIPHTNRRNGKVPTTSEREVVRAANLRSALQESLAERTMGTSGLQYPPYKVLGNVTRDNSNEKDGGKFKFIQNEP